ncbi:hypothetical protein CDLVIII_5690 [Clostridium sp. DL-VIII]|uniref:CA_C0660 family putative sactipeptide bacteriocin n=1 Tax=Clostridium sp. DL-VIII TaxID=641107 RepID=UPI00023B079C|nr:CA_C0660 family putative sactipeptide bacteriocin [Clostridium sp. DL-VIII]EHJ02160.1 hypothetical protein CDLVIII_5690 [Clostridium sp. DL-VIII]
MKIVNPLNRRPETEETMVMGGCHCYCNSGSSSTYNVSWFPGMPSCECNCNSKNSDDNYSVAFKAGH